MAAALRLFGTKGYGAVGIREIALEAGISTAALYHYMRTKEDLL
ncbi:MAG TPA: helix-turn-helix domain-containing protein, partial [Candidatus Dormibacteraeota bacterium]